MVVSAAECACNTFPGCSDEPGLLSTSGFPIPCGLLTHLSASSSYLTELVRGMTLEQAAKVKNTEIAKELVRGVVPKNCSSC